MDTIRRPRYLITLAPDGAVWRTLERLDHRPTSLMVGDVAKVEAHTQHEVKMLEPEWRRGRWPTLVI